MVLTFVFLVAGGHFTSTCQPTVGRSFPANQVDLEGQRPQKCVKKLNMHPRHILDFHF
jgi:hypothetical protein